MKRLLIISVGILVLFNGCNYQKSEKNDKGITITLGAYTVPKEVYQREIIPAFKTYWKEKTGETVRFEESYIASGAQSRAIAGGFEADIAALSLEYDIQKLKEIVSEAITNPVQTQQQTTTGSPAPPANIGNYIKY